MITETPLSLHIFHLSSSFHLSTYHLSLLAGEPMLAGFFLRALFPFRLLTTPCLPLLLLLCPFLADFAMIFYPVLILSSVCFLPQCVFKTNHKLVSLRRLQLTIDCSSPSLGGRSHRGYTSLSLSLSVHATLQSMFHGTT